MQFLFMYKPCLKTWGILSYLYLEQMTTVSVRMQLCPDLINWHLEYITAMYLFFWGALIKISDKYEYEFGQN